MAYMINRQAPMSGLSNLLALRGRMGDTELVHMSKPEISMLERMGKMTVNPRTGLPEAFSLEDEFRGLASVLNIGAKNGREAMQELMNFGRNKLADYNADPAETEMPLEAPTMPVEPLPMPQMMQPPMGEQEGLTSLLNKGGRPREYFEGMVDVNGRGDGMSDDVHFKVTGDPKIKNALLSRDEYVIAADVVSALGNGSSDAGAEKLDKFMKDVREEATGNPKQQKQMNGDKVLRELT